MLPADRPRLFYHLLVYRRRKGEPKGFTWAGYRDLSIAAHRQLSARWSGCGITSTSTWPRSWRSSPPRTRNGCGCTGCPRTRRTLIPRRASGRCSSGPINFAAADLDGLVRIVKRKLKKIQYRPHLIDGCLAATGLRIEPW